jgi:soluble lytic murein transglycosylase-like protein
MAMMRFVGRKAVVALAMSSALAACSSVDREGQMASSGAQTPEVSNPQQAAAANGSPDGAVQAGAQTASANPQGQNTVTLVKTSRLPIPVPAATEATSIQTAAMASSTMPPIVAFQGSSAAAATPASIAALQPTPSQPGATTILASARPTSTSIAKGGRVAAAVASGEIQPAAATAVALDEDQLTPDMTALQHAIPTPRPTTAVLAYASKPNAVSAVSAIDSRLEFPPAPGEPLPATAADAPSTVSKLIHRYAGLYGVPESLVHRVVHRESKYDPKAYHKNGYWGLMQIKYSTAKSMGYDGPPEGLLDAETNLKYAIKYLRGAWLVADNKNDNAIKLYARGYYYDAKRKDMLHVLDQ